MEEEAFVTCATNDTYALGALVLGHSLRNVQTSRKLAVIISQDVSDKIREQLQVVYDHLEIVNVLDSKDETNLAILARPDLGVTFTKFHCWRLTRYKKCVFLDADILVLQNCDELFERGELSAVPDVGWPDCFNSGVFVFQPNEETYKDILKFAITHGSFDGGDQGVLNMFFSDWRTADISKHLSFIYNMNANVTYTYLPAYKQFGKDVKIVHFLGAIKPWMQAYNSVTGRVEPESPHSLEHLQLWWNVFMQYVQPNLSQECKGLAGDLAKLHISPSCSGKFQSSEARQYAWERGQIDYLGADAFENIERKLQSAIKGSKETEKDVPKSPTTPKSEAKVATISTEFSEAQNVQKEVSKATGSPTVSFDLPQLITTAQVLPTVQESPRPEITKEQSKEDATAKEQPKPGPALKEQPKPEPALKEQPKAEPIVKEQPKAEPAAKEQPKAEPSVKEQPKAAAKSASSKDKPKGGATAKEPAKSSATPTKEAEQKTAPKKEPPKKEPPKKAPQKKGSK